MKIQILKLVNLRNDEHFQFFANFIELVNSTGAAKLNIESRFNTLVALHADEDEALKKITKSDFTRLLHDADRERDEMFRGLAEANRSALKHFKPAVREAAIHLQIVFDTYGNVAKKGDAEETSAITNLLNELTQHHRADMTTVGLNEWEYELSQLNQAFNKLEMQRDAETAVRTTLVLKETRARVDEAYRKLIERIDALALLAEDDAEDNNGGDIPEKLIGALSVGVRAEDSSYAGFIAKVNALIERFDSVLAIRKGKRQNQDSQD
jgi:hypothetical protein